MAENYEFLSTIKDRNLLFDILMWQRLWQTGSEQSVNLLISLC